jgi:hypothetical protein
MSLKEEQMGRFYFPHKKESGLIIPESPFKQQAEDIKIEKDIEEAGKLYRELALQKQEELDKKLETLELIPLGNKVILLPYPENPYRKLASKGGIIVEYNGSFNNPDSGEKDTLKTFVGCAKVIEIGPECHYLTNDDDVFYDTRTVYPVPFLSLGWVQTSEPQILCALNEGLTERFKNLKNG